jgi:cbb3-type cytochrome oxidase maturation protein
MALFAWALQASQFDDLQREGERILERGRDLDADQELT